MTDGIGIDFYGANPLADMTAAQNPAKFAAQATVGPPPKMFLSGTSDTPAFTASGIDPQALLKLPFGMRHAMAVEPDINTVYEVFENYGGMADGEYDCEGLREAKARMQKWSESTPDPRPEDVKAAESQAAYEVYARDLSRDGLLPEEREQRRKDQWKAKQDAIAAEQAALNERARQRMAEADQRAEAMSARNNPGYYHQRQAERMRGGIS